MLDAVHFLCVHTMLVCAYLSLLRNPMVMLLVCRSSKWLLPVFSLGHKSNLFSTIV